MNRTGLYVQSNTDITRLIASICCSHVAVAGDMHWSTYELTADIPSPALPDVSWDVCFE